jgi:hypothetical protein
LLLKSLCSGGGYMLDRYRFVKVDGYCLIRH